MDTSMFEAHVQFELARLSGDGLTETLQAEAAALTDWLDTVALGELAPAEPTATALGELINGASISDEAATMVSEVVLAAHAALSESNVTLADVTSRDDFDSMLAVVAGMTEVRDAAIDAFTSSSAYHRLVAHVLYHGIKGFVLTENLLARKIPGAAGLVKLGQRGLNTAVPGLESGIDRQLSAFVQANIGDTLRESRRYLEQTLDADTLDGLADEAWSALSGRSIGELVAAVSADDVDALVAAGLPIIERVVASGLVGSLVERVAHDLLTEYAEWSVAALLSDLGTDLSSLLTAATPLLTPAAGVLVHSGFVEERIRARLEPFYQSLDA